MKQGIFVKTAIAAALAGSVVSAHSLGLGEINVESNLNQRFSAVIPLSEISAEDLDAVFVTLAPNEAFDRAGVERSDYLNSLKFQVRGDGGRPRVVVTSSQIAREPVMNLLVQVRSKAGKIVREYTVLLDPPALPRPSAPVVAVAPQAATPTYPQSGRIISPAPAVAVPPPAGVPPIVARPPEAVPALPPASPRSEPRYPVPSRSEPLPEPRIERPDPRPLPPRAETRPLPTPPAAAPLPRPDSEFFETPTEARTGSRGSELAAAPAPSRNGAAAAPSAPVRLSGERYGPVKPGETLWRVATNLRPGRSVSMEQVMLALVEANPGTIRNGITLTEGSLLQVPAEAGLLSYSPREAKERLAAIQAGRRLPSREASAAAPREPAIAPVTRAPAVTPVPKTDRPALAAPVAPSSPTATVVAPPASATPAFAPPSAVLPAPEPAAGPSIAPGNRPGAAVGSLPSSEPPAGTVSPSNTPVEPPQDTTPITAPATAPAVAPPSDVAPPAATPDETFVEPNPFATYWPLLAGALLAGLLIFLGMRRRRRAELSPTDGAATAAALGKAAPRAPVPRSSATVSPPPPSRAGDTQVSNARALAEDRTPVERAAPSLAPAAGLAGALLPDSTFDGLSKPAARPNRGEGFETVPAVAPNAAPPADPLAEADFHLAYGLHDEAVGVLLPAIRKEPARRELKLKLAEAYFGAGKPREFEKLAGELQNEATPAEWNQLVLMGAQLAPASLLFQGATGADATTDFDLALDDLPSGMPSGSIDFNLATPPTRGGASDLPNLARDLADDEPALSREFLPAPTPTAKAAPASSPLQLMKAPSPPTDRTEVLARPVVPPAAPAPASPAEDPGSIDFMLGQSIVPLGMNTMVPSPAFAPARPSLPTAASAPVPAAPAPAASPSATAPLTPPKSFEASQEFDLGDTSFDVDSSSAASGSGLQLPPETDYEISLQSLQVSLTPREEAPASEDELNTKLDLARAYVEMDDHDSARGLLKEVLDQGNDQHKKEAEALMQRLPPG